MNHTPLWFASSLFLTFLTVLQKQQMVELMMITSMWESITSWFTPIVLFCLINFIIVTVFIASKRHHDHGDSPSLTRVSSFIDRAASKTAYYSSTSRLAQSIYFSPNYAILPELAESVELSPSQLARVDLGDLDRVKSFKISSVLKSEPGSTQNESVGQLARVDLGDLVKIANSPGQLARAPSFLDRVKSFKISPVLKSEPGSTQNESVDSDPVHNPELRVVRGKSEKTVVKKLVTEMKKSRSEVNLAPSDDEEDVDLRRPATTRESRNECDEGVDAKADDFIIRFKKQLKLQRLESLVRYNELLNRRS